MAYGLVLCMAPGIPAQTPTFSIEAAEVNGTELPQGPDSEVTVSPGDIVTALIFIRDWSPNGEKLRSYQATLDSDTFATGDAGTVQPVGYGNPNNTTNSFIDESRPDYIHHGLHTLPVADTSPGSYRWIDVLFNAEEGPVSKQDGRKYYCGTVRLQASADAHGTFKLALATNPSSTLIVDPANAVIKPLALEPLLVQVEADSGWLRIQSSDPPNHSVDARAVAKRGTTCAWNSIRLKSSGDASGVTADDFVVDDGSDRPPRIQDFQANGSTVELRLDRGIAPYRWTKITHRPSATSVRIGCLPGDVNNDSVTDGRDLLALVETLNGKNPGPVHRTDIDNDGKLGSQDLARLIDILEAGRRTGHTRMRGK